MADLFEKIGWVNRVLELVAYLVVVVAAGTILASLYNTMNERRREFAILRSLGARKGTVFSAIVLEAHHAALGTLAGYLVRGSLVRPT
jgi:putative ABC transport system permease protein